MKQIPSQPIFRYLQYPASPKDVVVDALNYPEESNLHETLAPMRGQITRPVFITSAFWKYMVKAMKPFQDIMIDVVKENNGACGCLTTYDYGDMSLGNVRGQFCVAWYVSEDVFHSFMFVSMSGISVLIGYMCNNPDGSYNYFISEKFKQMGVEKEINHAMFCLTAAAIILLCLEKYAEVEVKELKPGKKHKVKEDGELVEYQPMGNQAFQIMDCRWFTEICSDKDFSVNGHFKMQPYKDIFGHWQKKLIYVDTYVKHGYHRKATIDKIREGMA